MSGRVWSSTRKSSPKRLASLTQASTCSRRSRLANPRRPRAPDGRLAVRQQIGRLAQRHRQRIFVFVRLAAGTVRHPINCQRLIELGHRAKRCDAQIEVRARGEPDAIPRVLLPVRDGDDGRNAKVAGHIEHPQAASHCGVPGAQIPKVIVAWLIEVDLGAPQAIVPPDRAGHRARPVQENRERSLPRPYCRLHNHSCRH
jgi:hypothetical protein